MAGHWCWRLLGCFPDEIGEIVQREKISTLWLTASLFHLAVEKSLDHLCDVRQLLAGGDVLQPALAIKAAGALRNGKLINGYGPTENTTFTCCYAVDPSADVESSVPIGVPVSQTQVYILDQNLDRVPPGVSGELHAGGEGLARGYLNRPELTAEKFIPNPFSEVPGDRMYRTGDRVREREDGNIEFIGRVDNQIKVRGYRIEPAEVEAALYECPGVAGAAVMLWKDDDRSGRLVAYVVGEEQAVVTAADLRNRLEQHLPEYMVPSQFVLLDKFPLTPAGKIDRKALPRPEIAEEESAPQSQTEIQLAEVCASLLNLDSVPLNATFMELGGSSLDATQAVAAIRDKLACRLPIRELLGGNTLREIAAKIEDSVRSPLPEASFGRRTRDQKRVPASYSQERVWFVLKLDSASLAYHFTGRITLTGDLDISALGKALNRIVERHEIYRTTLMEIDGKLFQEIHEPWKVDLAPIDTQRDGRTVDEIVANLARQPFDIAQLPLVRWTLLRVNPQHHVLVPVEHHIVHDGWSFHVFLKELTELYRYFPGRPNAGN